MICPGELLRLLLKKSLISSWLNRLSIAILQELLITAPTCLGDEVIDSLNADILEGKVIVVCLHVR